MFSNSYGEPSIFFLHSSWQNQLLTGNFCSPWHDKWYCKPYESRIEIMYQSVRRSDKTATDTTTPKGKYTESLTFSTPNCIYANYGKLGKPSLHYPKIVESMWFREWPYKVHSNWTPWLIRSRQWVQKSYWSVCTGFRDLTHRTSIAILVGFRPYSGPPIPTADVVSRLLGTKVP